MVDPQSCGPWKRGKEHLAFGMGVSLAMAGLLQGSGLGIAAACACTSRSFTRCSVARVCHHQARYLWYCPGQAGAGAQGKATLGRRSRCKGQVLFLACRAVCLKFCLAAKCTHRCPCFCASIVLSCCTVPRRATSQTFKPHFTAARFASAALRNKLRYAACQTKRPASSAMISLLACRLSAMIEIHSMAFMTLSLGCFILTLGCASHPAHRLQAIDDAAAVVARIQVAFQAPLLCLVY